MKKIYMLFLLSASINLSAQLILTKSANEPVIGDIRNGVDHDSTSAIPKNTGPNQTWDFSSFTKITFTETTTYTTIASIPGASLYPGATIAAQRGQNEAEFYRSGNNVWEFMGDYNSSSSDYICLTANPGVFYSWPISFGSTFSDLASGFESSGSSTTALSGTVSYTASGTGTVILPGGLVYSNCLQVVRSILVTFGSGTNSMVMDQKTYQYFSSGKKFPIVEINYQKNTDNIGTTLDYWAQFNNMDAPVGINEQNISSNTISVFPNPADQILYITPKGNDPLSTIIITDVNGKVVFKGLQQESIDVSGLDEGFYLIELNNNGKLNHQRFIIQR